MQAILHNVRSVYNVASMFRTADGLGVDTLYLSGYTPTPTDRFGRSRHKFQKVALGAEKTVDFESVEDITQLIGHLQESGVTVLACEPTDAAVDYRSIDKTDICLVFGSEPDGLPAEVIDMCEAVVEIPMRGEKSSLNVSVAFGILSSHFIDSKK